jgi:transcription elongation factor GreA
MQDEFILTPAKYKALEEELHHLSTVERSAIAERIRQARDLGDLRENFDYHDAKRQQGLLEGKITGIKRTLERATVVDYGPGGDVVSLGSIVKVHDMEFDEEIEYTIVGVMDADAALNKISNTSPVGRALLGHKVGETVDVETPAGKAQFTIVELQ